MDKVPAAKNINLLMCAPGEKCEGGISAVVFGLMEGVRRLDSVECTRIVYAKPYDNLSRSTRMYYEVTQFANYLRQLSVLRPDIVHVQSSFDKKTIFRDGLYLWAARLFEAKFVLHAHGGAWHERERWSPFWKRLSLRFLEGCSAVLVTSAEELGQVGDISGQIKALKIDNPVQAPVDIKAISSEAREARSGKARIVFASRHIETKGLLESIEAFSLLGRSDCELHVFGNGPLHDTARQMSQSFGVQDGVHFHGNVSLEELVKEYLKSDVYLFPSYHHEGFPMALFFAAACSLPIVCTKVRPLPDFFTEPQNCLWVDPRDPRMLAEKLGCLLDNADLRRSMSENNSRLVERFDIDKIASELQTIYRSLLNSH